MMRLMIMILFFTSLFFGLMSNQTIELQAQDEDVDVGAIAIDSWDVEMVYVPYGIVELGVERDVVIELCESLNFSPDICVTNIEATGVFNTQDIAVNGFWIDRYETSIEQFTLFYEQCLRDNICSSFANLAQHNIQDSASSGDPQFLDWFTAFQYCYLRGSRLPTEAEWEYAASGMDNLIYPWGNVIELDHIDDYYSVSGTYPVGSKPLNVSWVGAFDMAGNVSEWVDDPYRPYRGSADNLTDDLSRVVRGGSIDDLSSITTYVRFAKTPNNSFNVGVRCARSTTPN